MERKEIWKDIKGFEGYQVSNLGNIRTYNKITYTERHGVRHWKSRILKQKWCKATRSKNRYDARVDLWKEGKPYTFLVARLVATTFLGESDLTVNHIDGNPANNELSNLEFVSRKSNITKGFEMGLYTTQKKVLITNKKTREAITFRSLSLASKFINRSVGYISNCIKQYNKFENDSFEWELL